MTDDNKYKNGKIYTIRYRNDDSLIYVGSTIVPLYKRFSDHKGLLKKTKYENVQIYKKMNETDINDWYIELYEDCPCERKEQLTQREGQVIREIATLNKVIPGRTKKEWSEDNKDKILDKKKEYYDANKDKAKEYYEDNKTKIKKYKEDNKDKIQEKAREYYEANKDKKKKYYEANKLKKSQKH